MGEEFRTAQEQMELEGEASKLARKVRFALAITSESTWHPKTQFLKLYIINEDSPQTHVVIEEHLKSCENCRKKVQRLEKRWSTFR